MSTDTIETPEQTPETAQPEPFTIDTDAKAEWLLRKLANLEGERARVSAQAAALIKQIDSDAAGLQHLYGPALEAYVRSKIAATGGRRKSITFLQGTCALRSVPAGVRITDMNEALYFAIEKLPEAVRTVETLDVAAYREFAIRRLQQGYEAVPGIETTPERESFSIRHGKSE